MAWYRFKSWRTYIKLCFFGIFGFGLNMKRLKGNPSGMRRGWEIAIMSW